MSRESILVLAAWYIPLNSLNDWLKVEAKMTKCRTSDKLCDSARLVFPVCGTQLEISTLKINDEELGRTEWLLLFDCPTGDYHGTLRQQQVISILAEAAARMLR